MTVVGVEEKSIADQPNVLWILTDDHRYDSICAFNKMLHGREMSELGYVESPSTDRLAKNGHDVHQHLLPGTRLRALARFDALWTLSVS